MFKEELRKIGVNLKDEEGTFAATVIMTNEALFGCKQNQIVPLVAGKVVELASSYVLTKKTGERITIACEELRMVVTGIVMSQEDLLEIIVTNVYGDTEFVKDKYIEV